MNLKDLKKEIPYQWKIQAVPKNGKKGCCVAYIDARDVMDLLDEVCGPENWQSEFYQVKNTMFCKIGILIGDTWVWKSDAGSSPDESSGEDAVIKGEPSDSLKRAAVQWGIGRFLYSKEMVWITEEEYNANKYKLTEFCNKGRKPTTENPQNTAKTPPVGVKPKDLMEYIEEIRAEKDINHLQVLVNEAGKIYKTENQLEWIKREASDRRDKLYDLDEKKF